MKLLKISTILSILFLLSCSKSEKSAPLFMASSFPIYAILSELSLGVADVEYLVPSGASPHTYTPKPSDIKKTSNALALFYIADNLDGWIKEIPAKNVIKMIDLVDEKDLIYYGEDYAHSHEGDEHHYHSSDEIDPHFWLNPLVVNRILKELTDKLIELYPEGKDKFVRNKEEFALNLYKTDKKLYEIFDSIKGETVFLHHPSFNYMLSRYGLVYGGAIEESPGKEPSPRFLAQLIDKIQATGTKAIFSEPQLNLKTANIIADECKVKLCELNPEGSIDETKTYTELLLYNATILRDCLE